jgi:hypothetical protein
MGALEDLGLRITYKDNPIPAVALSISPTPSLASSATAVSGMSHTFADPLRRPAPSFTMSNSSFNGSSRLVASSPIRPEFKVPLRPDSTFSNDHGQASRVPFSTPHITMPFSTSPAASAFVPYSPRPRTESSHQSHSLYLSQMESEVSALPPSSNSSRHG